MRDSQRQKVYDAERSFYLANKGRTFGSVEEIEEYANKLIESAWFKRHFVSRTSRLKVLDGRGRRRGGSFNMRHAITMPVWTRFEPYVLHEIAHLYAGRCKDSQHPQRHLSPVHGWHFAFALRLLVTHQMGKEAGDALTQAFKDGKVRYRRPPVISAAERQRRSEHMAAVRGAAGPL